MGSVALELSSPDYYQASASIPRDILWQRAPLYDRPGALTALSLRWAQNPLQHAFSLRPHSFHAHGLSALVFPDLLCRRGRTQPARVIAQILGHPSRAPMSSSTGALRPPPRRLVLLRRTTIRGGDHSSSPGGATPRVGGTRMEPRLLQQTTPWGPNSTGGHLHAVPEPRGRHHRWQLPTPVSPGCNTPSGPRAPPRLTRPEPNMQASPSKRRSNSSVGAPAALWRDTLISRIFLEAAARLSSANLSPPSTPPNGGTPWPHYTNRLLRQHSLAHSFSLTDHRCAEPHVTHRALPVRTKIPVLYSALTNASGIPRTRF